MVFRKADCQPFHFITQFWPAYDPMYGARPLRRAIQKLIEDPLSEKVLGKEYLPGSTILIATDREGRVVFEKVEAPESGADLLQTT